MTVFSDRHKSACLKNMARAKAKRHPLHRGHLEKWEIIRKVSFKGATVFNLPIGWFKQTPHRSVCFCLSHRSSHQSPAAANNPPIRYYHSVMSIIALMHHHRSLPPSLPSLSLTCQKRWRERSVSRGLVAPGRAADLTIWYDWAGMSATPVRVSLTIQCMSHVSYLSHLSLLGGGCQGQ